MNEPGPWVTISSAPRSPLRVRYIDLAGEEDESSRRDFAGGKDLGARRIRSEFPKPGNPANFRRLQYREHLVVSSFEK